MFLFACASFFFASRFAMTAEAADSDCPGPGEAFVTTCSGAESHPNNEPLEEMLVDDLDFVEDVVSEDSNTRTHDTSDWMANNKGSQRESSQGQGQRKSSPGQGEAPLSPKNKMKATVQQYYDPLPSQGKCCIGCLCGFVSSRLSLGVANRVFRLAGATWVFSEVMETSGFCDEATCALPEEAQHWVDVLRKALVKQCLRVRMIARRIWDRERIRELAQKDAMLVAGAFAGAFIGFIV